MTDLEVFTYTDHQVRTVLIDGEPWFVAADVTPLLGYTHAPSAIRRLDDDEYTQVPFAQVSPNVRTPEGQPPRRPMTVVNEAGLYSLILWSQKPGAVAFKRWVTHDVLPRIRRTGQFAVDMPLSQQLQLAADAAKRAEELEELRALDAPKVEAFDSFMDADGHYTMEAAAKSLRDVTGGMGRNQLFRWLRENRILMGNNNPYQHHAHWFKVVVGSYTDPGGREHVTHTTHVRPEGLDALRRRFGDPR